MSATAIATMTTTTIDCRAMAAAAVKTRLLLIGALAAAMATCAPVQAGESDGAGTPQDLTASEDTPARRAPSAAPLPEQKQEPGAGPGGAIFNPFSQAQAPTAALRTEAAPGATVPEEVSLGATVVAALGGLAILACLLRLLLRSA
jgi:hypothetical protein